MEDYQVQDTGDDAADSDELDEVPLSEDAAGDRGNSGSGNGPYVVRDGDFGQAAISGKR